MMAGRLKDWTVLVGVCGGLTACGTSSKSYSNGQAAGPCGPNAHLFQGNCVANATPDAGPAVITGNGGTGVDVMSCLEAASLYPFQSYATLMGGALTEFGLQSATFSGPLSVGTDWGTIIAPDGGTGPFKVSAVLASGTDGGTPVNTGVSMDVTVFGTDGTPVTQGNTVTNSATFSCADQTTISEFTVVLNSSNTVNGMTQMFCTPPMSVDNQTTCGDGIQATATVARVETAGGDITLTFNQSCTTGGGTLSGCIHLVQNP